jgi:hypothetical protein
MRFNCASLVSFALVLVSSVAFGQPVSPTPSVMPNAQGITSFCAALPPPNAPTRSGPATTRYQVALANAGEAFSQGRPASAAPLYWQAFTIVASDPHPVSRALVPQIGDRIRVMLTLQGDATRDQRCALAQCLIDRTTGADRAPFEQLSQELRCSPATPPPNPVPTPPIVPVPTPHVVVTPPLVPTPLVVRPRVPNPPILPPTVPARSRANWALHISGWSAGALGFIGFGVFGALCESANETAVLANSGQTDGWDRATHAQARTFCTLANVSLGVGLAATAATTTTFFLTRPRLSVVPPTGPNRAGFVTFTASF